MKSLDQQPTVVLREVAASDRQLALRSYLVYIDIAEGKARRMFAMRRVADLRLLIAEEALASGAGGYREGFHAAVEDYRRLLREYPAYPAADEVHYQIARAYDSVNEDMKSLEALTVLTQGFPQSPRYLEAQFRRGEILFKNRDYAGAERAYSEVAAAGQDAGFYEQALYKRGWARYLQGQTQTALADFMVVLERSLISGTELRTRLSPEALPRAQRELVDDTLRVISLSFAREGGPVAASAYFARAGATPLEPLIYSSLAEYYLKRNLYAGAVESLRAFIERNPLHEQAPVFQMRIAEIWEQAGEPQRAVAAREEFTRVYGKDSAYWKQRDIARMPLVSQRLREELMTMAQRAHAAAQASHNERDYVEAARSYRDYLAFFPDDDRAPELAFLLGELLFEQGRYGEAIEYYEQSAYRYSPHARAAEAGYAALLSYQRYLDQLGTAPSTEAERQAVRARSIEASTRFVSQFPRHPQVATVLTRTAEQLLAAGQYSRALTLAQRITNGMVQAGPELRRAAFIVIADVYFERKEYAQAEAAYTEALAMPAAGAPARTGESINERLAASIYHQGEQARAAGDKVVAREQFLRAAAVLPGSAIAQTAHYDAIAITLAQGETAAAITMMENFRHNYPQSRWHSAITGELALAYLAAGDLMHAAEEFGRVSAEHAKDDPAQAREALWRSAELYQQAGDKARAALAWQRYIVAFPEPVDRAIEARLRIAEAFQSSGNADAQQRWLGEIVAAFDKAGAAGGDFGRQAAAQAALELAKPLGEKYQSMRLVIPLDRSLREKRQAMDAALEAYGRAAGYGVAQITTAATFQIGEIYHGFGRALLDSERPADLNAEELEEYNVLLEEQASPFEEQAIEVHEVNFHRIAQGIYDDWVRASLDQLAELMPVRYGKREKKVEIIETLQ
ncbi:MAG: tetratricopeptide repeat protein [Chromatiales bacterium]|nr:tetratricopeptide repeat protein [Chromatiales bacterium]